jgi:triosephosphate isomerase
LNNEDDYLIALKTKIAIENGMSVILCIGDLLKEKQEGKTFDALSR